MSSLCLIFALFFINNHPVQREKARLVHFTTVKILALVAGSLSDYIITTTVAFLMEAVTPIILGLQMSWKYNVMELTLEKECGELRSSLNVPICQLSPSHWPYFPVGRFKICLEIINFFLSPILLFPMYKSLRPVCLLHLYLFLTNKDVHELHFCSLVCGSLLNHELKCWLMSQMLAHEPNWLILVHEPFNPLFSALYCFFQEVESREFRAI